MEDLLTPRAEEIINEQLRLGKYKSPAEVIADALDALIEREKLIALRKDLQEADEQFERGEYEEYDLDNIHELAEDVVARGMERLAAERRKSDR
jgi:Arc/MetJ-type ribon-helix-helix transcriptional regulator